MPPAKPPKAVAVDVVAVRPSESDRTLIAQLKARAGIALPQVAYVVKVRCETKPPATSEGWALYVDGLRIPKYWEYNDGVYFKVVDPQFFADYEGEPLRFSQDGTRFIDTGLKLAPPKSNVKTSARDVRKLPLESDVLK